MVVLRGRLTGDKNLAGTFLAVKCPTLLKERFLFIYLKHEQVQNQKHNR